MRSSLSGDGKAIVARHRTQCQSHIGPSQATMTTTTTREKH